MLKTWLRRLLEGPKRPESAKIVRMNGGVFIVFGNNMTKKIDLRKMPPEEKFEALRWTVLNMGMVWTPETAKTVEKLI